ncbi:MAG TPA: hypothetical protein VLA19_11015 [Herpetosiphonaceae bacterium]|nr:hypothetical protein [Herpetosiphonaceae bacterium]
MRRAHVDWRFLAASLAGALLVVPPLLLLPLWRESILSGLTTLMLMLLGLERARGRRRVVRLAAQLRSLTSLEKIEIPDSTSAGALDQALNDAIQRAREQALTGKLAPQPIPRREALQLLSEGDGTPRSVAVLALGLRDQDQAGVSPETMEHLREIAGTVVEVAERRSALLQMQGSSTFALIFAAFAQEPAARSAKAALDAAAELFAAHPALHFGLSSGTGMPCTLPGAGYTVIGSPLEEAIRLHRLAATWNEYRLLCPEPVALLLRPHAAGSRTSLQLTSSHAPSLPVYSLDVVPEAIALGA